MFCVCIPSRFDRAISLRGTMPATVLPRCRRSQGSFVYDRFMVSATPRTHAPSGDAKAWQHGRQPLVLAFTALALVRSIPVSDNRTRMIKSSMPALLTLYNCLFRICSPANSRIPFRARKHDNFPHMRRPYWYNSPHMCLNCCIDTRLMLMSMMPLIRVVTSLAISCARDDPAGWLCIFHVACSNSADDRSVLIWLVRMACVAAAVAVASRLLAFKHVLPNQRALQH